MKLNRNILNRIITEAMTNLAHEDIDPSNEMDGIESVEQEKNNNPLNDVANHMFEPKETTFNENKKMKKQTVKLTESQVNKIVKNSVRRIIKEMSGMESDTMYYMIDKLDALVEECNDLGLYDMSEDINEIIQKYQNDSLY